MDETKSFSLETFGFVHMNFSLYINDLRYIHLHLAFIQLIFEC